MNIEKGVIVKVRNGIAVLEVDPLNACNSCASRHSCASMAMTAKRKIRVRDHNFTPGDTVEFYFREQPILRSSFIIYGLPVLMIVAGMFAGAALGHRLVDDSDLASGIGGLAGFGISLALSSLYSRRLSGSSSCEPEILSIRRRGQH